MLFRSCSPAGRRMVRPSSLDNLTQGLFHEKVQPVSRAGLARIQIHVRNVHAGHDQLKRQKTPPLQAETGWMARRAGYSRQPWPIGSPAVLAIRVEVCA